MASKALPTPGLKLVNISHSGCRYWWWEVNRCYRGFRSTPVYCVRTTSLHIVRKWHCWQHLILHQIVCWWLSPLSINQHQGGCCTSSKGSWYLDTVVQWLADEIQSCQVLPSSHYKQEETQCQVNLQYDGDWSSTSWTPSIPGRGTLIKARLGVHT